MIRPLLGFCCSLALLASATTACATDASDRDMAERYSKAAQAGDNQAQFYLGALYSAGVGLRQSDEQAFEWISRAAQQGHSQAMLILAGFLAVGRGVKKEDVAAYKWAYIVAEASRLNDLKNGARQLVDLLETRMTPADIAQAKSDAERFRATRPQSSSVSGSATSSGNVSAPQPGQSAPSVSQSAPASSPSESRSTSERDSSASRAGRSSDIDQLLDRVPQGTRQRYGF